jgi:hypothetical protein
MPVEPAIPAEAPVVPIETLLVEKPRRPSVRVSQTPGRMVDEPGLAGSYLTLARLLAERGPGLASLDELLSGPPPAGTAPGADQDVVDISLLCYHGRGALERAAVVRRELDEVLSSTQLSRARPLIDELVDLVSLAAEPS